MDTSPGGKWLVRKDGLGGLAGVMWKQPEGSTFPSQLFPLPHMVRSSSSSHQTLSGRGTSIYELQAWLHLGVRITLLGLCLFLFSFTWLCLAQFLDELFLSGSEMAYDFKEEASVFLEALPKALGKVWLAWPGCLAPP